MLSYSNVFAGVNYEKKRGAFKNALTSETWELAAEQKPFIIQKTTSNLNHINIYVCLLFVFWP